MDLRIQCVAPDLLLVRVPDRSAGKNRLRLDLRRGDQKAEVARLEELGARPLTPEERAAG